VLYYLFNFLSPLEYRPIRLRALNFMQGLGASCVAFVGLRAMRALRISCVKISRIARNARNELALNYTHGSWLVALRALRYAGNWPLQGYEAGVICDTQSVSSLWS